MYRVLQLILFAVLFNGYSSYAQSTDSLINDIRAKYQSIRIHLKSYDTISREELDETAEGGQTNAFYNNTDLKLIEIISYFEMGKYELELYFDRGLLFFAYEKRYKYNRPIYWDKKYMQKNNDSATYDPKKTVVEQERYYFHHEKLIRWLDNDKKEVDLSLETSILFGEYLVGHAHKLRDNLKK